jgi:hypothetical protein
MALFRDQLTIVWLLLMLATGLSWFIGHGGIENGWLASSGVIAVAFFKIRFVGLDFMELRSAPRAWRMTFEVWLLLLAALLVALSEGSFLRILGFSNVAGITREGPAEIGTLGDTVQAAFDSKRAARGVDVLDAAVSGLNSDTRGSARCEG